MMMRGTIIGIILAVAILAITLLSGCGDSAARFSAQTTAQPVVCTHDGVITLETTIDSMRQAARTTSPPRCGVWTGIFGQATRIEPVPLTTVPEVVCFKDSTGQWYLVDPRDCTGLEWIGALPTPGCPPDVQCYRGEEPPCP